MKKLRNLLFTLAILTLCLLLLPTEADAAGVWDLTFELNDSSTGYEVTDCNEAASGKLTIPKTYKEKPVTSIGIYAFDGCTSLTSVTIPDSVTHIDDSVFENCTNLASVTIPDSVTSIRTSAFQGCTRLKKVYYGGSQTQWESITIYDGNQWLNHAEKVYYYKGYNRSATVIKTSGANIWSEPSTSGSSKLVRTAKYNTKLNVTVKYTNTSGSVWYQLSDGNWVYSTNILPTDYNHADIEGISAESESKTFVVTSWGANIWSKPYSSGDSKVAYSAEKTAALKVVAQVRNSTGGLWYMLEDGNWIYSKNVNERIFDPADVVAYKRSATVIVPGVINIWGQPSTKAPSTLTRTAAYQTKLNVVAKYTTPSGGLWYQLTDGNWVYSTNIRITDYNPADVQKVNKTITVTS